MSSGSVLRPIAWIAVAAASAHVLGSQPVYLANASFESPATEFVDPLIDHWRKTPKPVWYDESDGFTWDQLSGVFRNTVPGEPDHIGNCDGAQAIFLFAVPEVGIYQDDIGAGARFEPGKSYTLTTGVIGGGGGMTNGVSLEMSLYYLDASGNRLVVGSTNIVHDPERFPNQTNLVDIQLKIPAVRPADAWAGRPMGIRFLSTVDPSLAGGYWDLDNVRLEESIEIPNGSFESPVTAFVDNRVDVWQKTPKPDWYDDRDGFTWDQLSGVFRNTDPGADDHLENIDGAQGFYLFAVPEVGLFLEAGTTNNSLPGAGAVFHATYEPGRAYALTLGVHGGGGLMVPGATLELGLYYRDSEGTPQTIASLVITNDAALFPSPHLLTDFQVRTPVVAPTDPWAGKGIGLRILSTVDPSLAGGYWDVDHARLEAYPEPMIVGPEVSSGRFGFVVRSEPGARFDVLEADSVVAPAGAWTTVGTVTNVTGVAEFSATLSNSGQRYYRLRQTP